ncbi:phage terminase small subunit [Natronincola ferrireducens]|uniref:Uncharacterized protein YjcR n=1 Tax=Natronincola ferrireducens TaxID=393762 RepID=A0A1G9I463_9FIRM|nr:phage terminase small subunit [Natronincola ferrireducens]SDL20027.1 Uncharacterized protein YjcR [Natronincola ferrireducens]
MGRQRSPNRDAAHELYKNHNGNITSKEIAEILNEKVSNINTWRVKDKWRKSLNKVGAPYNNQNAVGNKGGGAPQENQNARTYGWYSKYYPAKARNLIKEAEEAGETPLEILWAQIMTQWIAIIRAQKIMFVKNKEDKTKELKKLKSESKNLGTKSNPDIVEVYREEEYEIQQAWDKHATFLNAQSKAMGQLTNMLKRYDEMLHANWDTTTEEQKLRVERLRVQIKNDELKAW